MMGTDDAPGIVPHAIAELFRTIDRTPKKEFLLRLSMMEIYNEARLRCRMAGWLGLAGCRLMLTHWAALCCWAGGLSCSLPA